MPICIVTIEFDFEGLFGLIGDYHNFVALHAWRVEYVFCCTPIIAEVSASEIICTGLFSHHVK